MNASEEAGIFNIALAQAGVSAVAFAHVAARGCAQRSLNVTEWHRKSVVLAVLLGAFGFAIPALADEEPKRGGSLNYMIPADAPPSFDGHRETTYATIHTAAPFYSVLIRVNPDNPVVNHRFRLRPLHLDAAADR